MTTSYFIGDLCYVFEDADWEEICNLLFPKYEYTRRTGQFLLKDGREFFMFGTAHGDGEYRDQFGNSYGVDSGSIGAIRVEDIRGSAYSEEYMKQMGCIHTFESPLTSDDCSYQDGLIRFSHVEIDTDPSCEEEMEQQNAWLEEDEDDPE